MISKQPHEITALIRTHPGREVLLQRAIQSCARAGIKWQVHYGEELPDYQYNLYCNDMKAKMTSGYFFFLDSDDAIIPGSINKILKFLDTDKALIVQMLRNGKPKPKTELTIRKGTIGMPCLFLHHSAKFAGDVTATEWGDWDWIHSVMKAMNYDFVKIPVVDAGKRNHGK